MAKITYLDNTILYSSTISTLNVFYPPTVNKNDTLLMVVLCHDIGKTPTTDSHWTLVKMINGATFSTFVYVHDHIIIPPVTPQSTIYGLSNKLNCGYMMRFSGCIINDSKLINAVVGRYNSAGSTGNNGFITTVNNTMIVHIMGMPQNLVILGWSSTPSLTWTRKITNNISSGPYILRSDVAISYPAPKNRYTSFNYSFIAGSSENISISLDLTSASSNLVLNLLRSF